jgi:hypothetical protein
MAGQQADEDFRASNVHGGGQPGCGDWKILSRPFMLGVNGCVRRTSDLT